MAGLLAFKPLTSALHAQTARPNDCAVSIVRALGVAGFLRAPRQLSFRTATDPWLPSLAGESGRSIFSFRRRPAIGWSASLMAWMMSASLILRSNERHPSVRVFVVSANVCLFLKSPPGDEPNRLSSDCGDGYCAYVGTFND